MAGTEMSAVNGGAWQCKEAKLAQCRGAHFYEDSRKCGIATCAVSAACVLRKSLSTCVNTCALHCAVLYNRCYFLIASRLSPKSSCFSEACSAL